MEGASPACYLVRRTTKATAKTSTAAASSSKVSLSIGTLQSPRKDWEGTARSMGRLYAPLISFTNMCS